MKFYRHLEIDCTEADVMQWRKDIIYLTYTLGCDAKESARLLQMLGLTRSEEIKPEYQIEREHV